eukprot:SAG31_NODE_11202_length_1054_cov_1.707853_1_plen_69_part_00
MVGRPAAESPAAAAAEHAPMPRSPPGPDDADDGIQPYARVHGCTSRVLVPKFSGAALDAMPHPCVTAQ